MLIEVDSKTYSEIFPANPHQFISESFTELNRGKVEKVLRLIEDKEKVVIGLIAGIKNGMLQSPFSAPFGGFHFRHENIYIGEIDSFLISLQDYIQKNGLIGIEITQPPDIYHLTFNAKIVNSMFRTGFKSKIPEITNWVDLHQFNGSFTKSNSREYYRQAVRNNLSFNITTDGTEQMEIYDLIRANRTKFGRSIFMTLKDILDTGNLWPVDFFKVNSSDGTLVASAIFYRNHPDIAYPVFWGDNEIGRPLRAMDFLTFNLWSYYKKMGYKYLDLGISTEAGNPNEGLLRFKETHEAISSLRYSFFWNAQP